MPLQLDNEKELREAQAALFNVNTQSGWVLVNYVGPQTVHFVAGGEGDTGDLKDHFADDQVQYGVLRLGGIQEEGADKATTRDVFFCWIGSKVGIIEKGKKSALLADAQEFLRPFHVGITVLNRDHFNRETVLDRSHPDSGSRVIE